MQVAGLGAVLVAYAALAIGYLAATPAWNNPDEPAHYNYIRHVAETGTLPVLEPGDWDAELLGRLTSSNFRAAEPVDTIRYESWQPPLYYALAAPVYLAAPSEQRLGALRLLGVVLGAATLAVGFAIGRELLKGVLPALAVPLVMAGVPMFTASAAVVSNDALANLLAAALVLVALRGMAGRFQDRQALIGGLILGAGLLTKLSLLASAPVLLAGLAHGAWYATRRWGAVARSVSLASGVAALLWLPWLLRNALTYGWNDPLASRRHDLVVVDQPRFPGITRDHLEYLATTLFHSFWAQFGWMAFPVDDRLYWLWGLLTLAAGGGIVLALVRGRLRRARWLIPLAAIGTLLAALAAYNLSFVQAQGRYLFPSLVPLAALFVAGWRELAPGSLRQWVPLTVGWALVGINVVTLLRYAAPALNGCGTVAC